MRVFLTGACGWTASSIQRALREAGHEVTGLDLPGVEARHGGLVELHRGDVAELEALVPLLDSAEAVVHLAIAVGPADYDSPDEPFRTNVRGTYAVFEGARRAGVGRVILIGSAPVHLVLPPGRKLDARRDQPSGAGRDFLYDLTKCLQEDIARQFCMTHGMTAVTLRAGNVVDGRTGVDRDGTPLSELQYCRGGWVCRHDLARAVLAALAWKGEGYEAFHVIGSWQARGRFDVDRTHSVLGVTPEVDFAEY